MNWPQALFIAKKRLRQKSSLAVAAVSVTAVALEGFRQPTALTERRYRALAEVSKRIVNKWLWPVHATCRAELVSLRWQQFNDSPMRPDLSASQVCLDLPWIGVVIVFLHNLLV
jgi:hypothetical protein